MNCLTTEKRTHFITALCEDLPLRSTVRMTGAAMNTCFKLLADVGQACAECQDKTLRNLPCKRIQCDDIRQFCYAKAKNVPNDKQGKFGYGDVWTWVAMDADTNLVPNWMVGGRYSGTAYAFYRT
jgi:hypothetical protein